MTGKHIAVYSGSFNPLHIGHLAIIRHLIDEAGFDCVYLVVSPKNPLKEGISEESGQDRFDAAVAAVGRHFPSQQKVKVDDIELNMPAPHYTIRTLDALLEREPENRFTLIMGADNLADIRRWKEYQYILKKFGVAVYPRQGFELEAIKADLLNESSAYIIKSLSAPMVNISSTEIRDSLAIGKDVSKYIM